MPLLAQRYAGQEQTALAECAAGDSRTGEALFARIARAEQFGASSPESRRPSFPLWQIAANPFARGAVAACLLLVGSFGVYRFAVRTDETPKQAKSAAEFRVEALTLERRALGDQLSTQAQKLAQVESDSTRKRQEIERLQAELRVADQRSGQLASSLS